MIKSSRLRRAGYVARMGTREVHTRFWWVNLREGDHLEDTGVDGRISKWIFEKWDGGHGTDRPGSCECGNKPSGSIECLEYPD